MATESLEIGLKKLGLADKEAKVYLATLELGPSPVQKIAQRAGVPRATTYLVLDDLKHKGLITTFEKGKKTYFAAESPQQLSALVSEKEVEITQQKKLLKDLIPELDAHGQFTKSVRPIVRYYEGDRAVSAFVRDRVSRNRGEILNFLHLNKAEETLQMAQFPIEKVRERRTKLAIKSRVIYTTDDGPKNDYSTPQRRAKFISSSQLPLDADVSVQGNLVIFIPYGTPLQGVAIEDKAIANAIRAIFESLWRNLP